MSFYFFVYLIFYLIFSQFNAFLFFLPLYLKTSNYLTKRECPFLINFLLDTCLFAILQFQIWQMCGSILKANGSKGKERLTSVLCFCYSGRIHFLFSHFSFLFFSYNLRQKPLFCIFQFIFYIVERNISLIILALLYLILTYVLFVLIESIFHKKSHLSIKYLYK